MLGPVLRESCLLQLFPLPQKVEYRLIRLVLKRLGAVIPVLFIVSIMLFVLISMLPGDAAQSILAEGSTAEDLQKLRDDMGLTQPLYQQYFTWIRKLLSGDLGKSLLTGQTVAEKLQQRLPVTLELSILAMILSVLIALPLGVISAVKRNTAIDVAASAFSVVGVAMPAFWLGMLLIIVFCINLGWLPASGYVPFWENPLENLRRMVLPSVTVALAFTATITRQTRAAMLEVLSADYILTARAKGLKKRIVLWKHALKNALIPVVTVVTMQTGRLVGGAVVTETVFALPGIGREIVDAIQARDYPVAMALIMLVVLAVIVMNLIADILYLFIDPRIRTQKGGRKVSA